jgi:hypothetical protein
VVITMLPEPGTWSLMTTGFGFLGYVLRRRVRQQWSRDPGPEPGRWGVA